MKKKLSSVVAVLAVAAVLFSVMAVSVFAAKPKLTLSTDTTSNGQTEVILSVSKGSDLATLQAALKYDADKVTLMSVEYLSGDYNKSNTDTAGVAVINDVWEESVNDKADLVRFVFSANDNAKVTFSLDDIKATDSNDNPINFDAPKAVKVAVKQAQPQPDTDGSGSSATPANISGSTDGNSPRTSGTVAASCAGVCAAAIAAAAVVIVLKKKNNAQ